jgi:hypothetical protein
LGGVYKDDKNQKNLKRWFKRKGLTSGRKNILSRPVRVSKKHPSEERDDETDVGNGRSNRENKIEE